MELIKKYSKIVESTKVKFQEIVLVGGSTRIPEDPIDDEFFDVKELKRKLSILMKTQLMVLAIQAVISWYF